MRVPVIALLVLCLGGPLASSADPDEDEEVEDLRERLTEREDKRRPERSWEMPIADRPLVISGEYEFEPVFARRHVLDDEPGIEQRDRLVSETGLEVEAFYSFAPALSLFGQVRLVSEREWLPDVPGDSSELFASPGEIWLLSEDVAGSGLDFDAGRLHFEDERRWWWDDEIEAARLTFERGEFEASIALAQRLLPERSDRSYVEPDEERVGRLIGQLAWDFAPSQGLELFAVGQRDRSRTERVGEIVRDERVDDSDARLHWLGARALGVLDLRPTATLGYWLDLAWLRGSEDALEFDAAPQPRRSEVQAVEHRHVSGFGWDGGVSVALTALAGSPRLFGGYARASRDFRQVGLENNEAGFGGVERFSSYGFLLDPDFSDLGIATLGVGLSLLESSSLDLVYHRYRLRSLQARFLPGIELEAELDSRHADLGQEIDLVLALEEWERLEFELGLAAFRSGRAFEPGARGETSLGAFFAVRVAF